MKTEIAEMEKELIATSAEKRTRIDSEFAECPLNYVRQENLLDGTQVTIRPICCSDKTELLAFHQRLSSDSLFLRYHYSKGQLTEEDLKNFCDIDYFNDLGLIAEVNRNGKNEIIGVGRYDRIPTDHTAEIAFIVQDSEQKKGVGTLLLRHLAILAWERGIKYFLGEILRQNGRMISILRKSDPRMEQEVDCVSTCTVKLSVLEAMQRKR